MCIVENIDTSYGQLFCSRPVTCVHLRECSTIMCPRWKKITFFQYQISYTPLNVATKIVYPPKCSVKNRIPPKYKKKLLTLAGTNLIQITIV